MPFMVGLITAKEKLELQRRGWTIEEPPPELNTLERDSSIHNDPLESVMIWVDRNLFEIMDGPDWEKNHDGVGETARDLSAPEEDS